MSKNAATTIKNVRVFDGEKLTELTNVTFENGYITNVGSDIPENSNIFDGKGQTLLPGYIDSHMHLDDIENLKNAVRCGITTMLDMNPKSAELVDSLRELPGLTSVFTSVTAGVGPGGLITKFVPIRDEAFIHDGPNEGKEYVDRMLAKGASYIKIILEMPPLTGKMLTKEQVLPIANRIHEKGSIVFAHATTEPAWRLAIETGCDVLNHLPRHFVLPDDIVNAVGKGKHCVIPTLIMLKGLIDQKPDGSNGDMKFCFESLLKLKKAGAIIITGTDSNITSKMNIVKHGESFLKELELMVEAGMTPVEVLRSMGITPSTHFKFISDRGTIEPKKRADLVLVEGDPTKDISVCRNIKKVWVKGIEAKSNQKKEQTLC